MSLKTSPTLKSSKIKVGITIGDPSGIGPEISARAIARLKGLAQFVVIGDRWVFNKVQGSRFRAQGYNFIDLDNVNHRNFKFGKVRAEYGRASIEYLDKALELLKSDTIDCLVTSPISKEAVSLAGLKGFSGHSEYLTLGTGAKNTVMMLLNNRLKISLVTQHVPLREVSRCLTKDKIYNTILVTRLYLQKFFRIRNPKLIVCGLNPHASDNGILGNEEGLIIRPAIKMAKRLTGPIDGPLPADIAILNAAEHKYDCVIAMYHDQALIPLKLSGRHSGINLTLGLAFVRTSPLHGTAFDIAGSGLADPASLIEAIKLAIRCTLNLKRN